MKCHRYMAAGLLSLIATPAFAQTPDAPPKTVSCIYLRDISSTDIRDDSTIIFKMHGRKYYKNALPHRCPGLGFTKAYSVRTSQTQLCNVDIIYVLENYGGTLREGAGCGLGKFEEYVPPPRKPKADKAEPPTG